MKKFIIYILLFISPIAIFFAPYFIGDPFKILRTYKLYYPEDGSPLWINNNRGYVSTMMYLQNKDTYQWDSFIFGSSRSGFYRIAHWKQYIPKGSKCFHFDGYGDSLYNIYKKLKFIDGKSEIKNALFCIDQMTLWQAYPEYGHLWITTPILEDYSNWTQFHMSGLKAYSKWDFLKTYIDFSLTHEVKPYMVEKGILDTVPHGDYDISTNECGTTLPLPYSYDTDTTFYTLQKRAIFYARPKEPQFSAPCLQERNKVLLKEMKEILERNHTNYQFVINPTYDQKKLAPEDMKFLQELFGSHLYDFSGRNLLSEDYRNFGDLSHFRQHVAAEVMRIMYEPDKERYQIMMDSLYNVQ